ncbi:MAG: carbamoyl-phosphate synthase (glutamine-hydrolyzing) small subunit [Calditrichaeota bacterium]|nr:MAG: carbamoyl-phosphate synthase (glutamine-hydrolyzing) small subunit [Calditrichota bacterium]
MNKHPNALLILEDGTTFPAFSFGYDASVSGELVFNTGMVGYVEALTDPSYYGQLLISTYPQVGNYGVPAADDPDFLSRYESARIQARAFIINAYSPTFDHWSAGSSLGDWLKKEKTVGLYGLDTRALTRHLRDKGAMLAKIIIHDEDVPFYDPNATFLLPEVSVRVPCYYGNGAARIALLDCGCKNSIVAYLTTPQTRVTRLPYNTPVDTNAYDGFVISSGPGDPARYTELLPVVREMMASGKPLLGICLGHQLMATAAGARTFKLPFGHRGQNQPVRLSRENRCYVTSQNHGYAVDPDTLSDDWQPWFINLNDQTNEGIMHASGQMFSVQFHPEAAPGPHDTRFLFDHFIKKVVAQDA